MKKNMRLIIPLIFCGIHFMSCANFKEINAYASSAQNGMKNINADNGYCAWCMDSCFTFSDIKHLGKPCDCDSDSHKIADSILNKEFHILFAYFGALAKLTGSKTDISFSPLSQNVAEGAYGKLVVSGTEAGAFGGLTTALTDMVTLHFKSKRVKERIENDYPLLQNVMNRMIIHITVLQADYQDNEIEFSTKVDVLTKSCSDAEKLSLIYIRHQKTIEYDLIISRYGLMLKTMNKVMEGYTTLHNNKGNLKSQNLKAKIKTIVSDISSIGK